MPFFLILVDLVVFSFTILPLGLSSESETGLVHVRSALKETPLVSRLYKYPSWRGYARVTSSMSQKNIRESLPANKFSLRHQCVSRIFSDSMLTRSMLSFGIASVVCPTMIHHFPSIESPTESPDEREGAVESIV